MTANSSAFTCFTEAETWSLNLRVSTVARKKNLLLQEETLDTKKLTRKNREREKENRAREAQNSKKDWTHSDNPGEN